MASVTLPTTSKVKTGAGNIEGKFGVTVAQGQFVYADITSGGKFKLAIATSPVTANVAGMARNSGTDGAPCDIASKGDIVDASGLTAGVVYVLSDTVAGGIMPVADLTVAPTGTYVTVIGVALLTTSLRLGIIVSSVQAD